MRLLSRLAVCALVVVSAHATRVRAEVLTFEDRVKATEALERVAYSHLIGATLPFERAVPREAIEEKVRRTAEQSAALARIWATPVTEAMLQAETARIVRSTRMPERLQELFATLHDDPLLIDECIARPALVDRMVRSFLAAAARFQDGPHAEAEELHAALRSGALDPRRPHPRRHELDHAPKVHRADELHERRDAFEVDAGAVRYVVPKQTWEEFRDAHRDELDEASIETVVTDGSPPPRLVLPAPSVAPTAPGCAPDDAWQHGALDSVPDPRSRHTAVWTGDTMIVWGGDPLTAAGSRYDLATDSWSSTSTVGAPSPRRGHTAIWTGNFMVVWGGTDGASSLGDGGRYDPLTDTWLTLSTQGAPSPRTGHTAVWAQGRMIVWGGTASDGSMLASGGLYDPIANTWTRTSDALAPQGRVGHSAVWTGSLMVVCGGSTGPRLLGDCARYDPQVDAWSPAAALPNLPPERPGDPPSGARAYHTAVWTGSIMIVWGGIKEFPRPSGGVGTVTVSLGARYDPVTDIMTATTPAVTLTARTNHTAIWTGTRMVVFGGWDGQSFVGTGGRYDPANDSWQYLSAAGAPSRRDQHTAIWTGARMLIWGGYDGDGLDTGARYDPQFDTWTPVSQGTAPAPRYGHASAWTGTTMVVWGGTDGSLRLGDGGRYDPVLDTWSVMGTNGAPFPREGHTAVWTGTYVLIWGGSDGSTLYGNGGRYNPVSNIWTDLSTTGAPSARSGHAAVGAGADTMVIWGGRDASGPLASGGRYHPSNDSWQSTTSTGAPSARSRHSAVWTGTRVLVWGGLGSTAFNGTSGRYDPVGDTWSAISTSGAPLPRADHTAVWTGTRMIVWGGMNGTSYLSTGGRYDPADDSWKPVSTVNAPSARRLHVAQWTGAQMLIWGGNGGPKLSGARYHPGADTWAPLTLAGSPTSRAGATAVWTGTDLFVWGGTGGFSLANGGAYAPGIAVDGDLDGFCDVADNCPINANANQADADTDGLGDVCDPFKVDFGPAISATAAGYVKDDGSFYTTARRHGWDAVVDTRERVSAAPIELDTLAFTKPTRTWIAEIPNGDYDVKVSAGDASYAQGPNRIVVQGTPAIDDVLTTPGGFVQTTVHVPVRDGRLVVTMGGTTGNTTLDLLEAVATASGSPFVRSINFQPVTSSTPSGFLADTGLAFDAARGYGWDAAVPTRERGKSIPQVLDTLAFTSALRTWEIAVSNGTYDVSLAVGDAQYAQGPQRIVVEGTTVVNNESTAAGAFLERTVRVTVADGRLTVAAGGTAGNTSLNYVVVASVGP